MTRMANWDSRFMELAGHIGNWSKCPDTKVGCVIVGPDNEVRAVGYNGFPRGVRDDGADRYARPTKYRWTEHAERNAIYVAARTGITIHNCRMYLPWFPCIDCSRGIVQAGLSELIAFRPDLAHPVWGEDFRLATALFEEAGVRVRWYEADPAFRSHIRSDPDHGQ